MKVDIAFEIDKLFIKKIFVEVWLSSEEVWVRYGKNNGFKVLFLGEKFCIFVENFNSSLYYGKS